MRLSKQSVSTVLSGVSIHAPARGATLFDDVYKVSHSVSIHAPARGATEIRLCKASRRDVSIHAPARGATTKEFGYLLKHRVSIHAPARGATELIEIGSLWVSKFQSTHPHGVRLPLLNIPIILLSFNPRTRTGCDTISYSSCTPRFTFQSTHPHGVRPLVCGQIDKVFMFQSTHPHGVRLAFAQRCKDYIPSFNPRTRTGCDF